MSLVPWTTRWILDANIQSHETELESYMLKFTMALMFLVLQSCGSSTEQTSQQASQLYDEPGASPIIQHRYDCRALASRSYAICETDDCRSIIRRTPSRCQSDDCLAVIYMSPSRCSTQDCRAITMRELGLCRSNNCRAVISKSAGLCH